MNRVALREPIQRTTKSSALVYIDRGAQVEIVKRGSTERVNVYSAETGGSVLSQPLVTDLTGVPVEVETETMGWVAPGRYDLLVGDPPEEGQEDARERFAEELASGGIFEEVGEPGGIASLDESGHIPADQIPPGSLPTSAMEFKGAWNASTNSPALADGSGNAGDVYRVTVAGSRNLGSGSIEFQVGDDLIYDGTVWFKVDTTDAVASVAGRTGAVVLTAADIGGLGSAATLNVGAPGEAGKVLRADEQGGFFGRRLIRILTEGKQDASIIVVGDSTSATYATWAGKVVEGLAARFPAYTVNYRDWTNGNTDYNKASEKQKGSGTKTLTVYNCAVSSTSANYQMAPYFEAMIASKQPDLIFFSHGHNQGGSLATLPYYRDNMVIATQTIQRACPMAEIVMFAQNPRSAPSTTESIEVQALRQFIVEEIARDCGFGFLNVHRLFLEADPTLASLVLDGIHPTPAGYTLIAEAVLRRMVFTSNLGSQQRSSFTVPAVQHLTNGDFSSFASPPTLTGWSAVNATLSKDTTNFESPNGYSVKMVTASPGNSYISQNLNGTPLKKLAGEWVALLARIRQVVGQDGNPGKVSINQANGSAAGTVASDVLTFENKGLGQGDFRWSFVTSRIAKDCTSANFTIAAHPSGSGEVSIDRAVLVTGLWPRDIR
jgi:lysophospholipase L1-like esterase